jgi:hypothetical protein
MNSLMGMIMGSGQVNLLLGRIQRYRVGFGSTTWCTPVSPLGRGAGWLGRVGRARGEADWAAPWIWPKRRF